jgi:hypothetical protein
VIAFLALAKEDGGAVLPAIGIDGEMSEVAVAATEEGGYVVGKPGRGGLRDRLVPTTPPRSRQADDETENHKDSAQDQRKPFHARFPSRVRCLAVVASVIPHLQPTDFFEGRD